MLLLRLDSELGDFNRKVFNGGFGLVRMTKQVQVCEPNAAQVCEPNAVM